MPGTVAGSEAPTVSLSFANNFWGKEDAGVTPLLTRMHNAKTTGDELKAFYAARAAIEEDYAKRLLSLAKKPLGSSEQGTLRMSLDVVKAETESMGKQHATIAQQMKSELDEPLIAFVGGIKERRKIVQTGIEKLLKTKNAQTMTVNKTRDRFEQDCLKIKGYLAQGHMVMGQEERKNKAKLEKTQVQMSSNSNEYEVAVKILEETTGKWNREWKAACDKFQDLEEERIDFFKSSLWSFANISSTVCVSDDQSCEKVRLSLEDCDVEKDITGFIKDLGTGQEIPDPPKYINFCRGDVDDAGSSHGSDDGEYSVAQFQRTMNPTFRSSSPQPSTFESHHDPDSSLRDEMGLPKGRSSVQGDNYFDPRGSTQSTGSGAPPSLHPSGSGLSQTQPDPYADAPRIPHNPFPTDGMTQFCRPNMGPPSERSSIPSPVRPVSSGSMEHSDYTNPTSLSDMEPGSGAQSPMKMNYNGSAMSGMSGMSGMSSGGEEQTLQKKKSGFFSNSPFRRRSQKTKDPAPRAISAAPSANRKSWAPQAQAQPPLAQQAPAPVNTRPISTRPFAAGHTRSKTWQPKQPSPTPEAEQADPRAEQYQLGIGNNVFDVASPVPNSNRNSPTKSGASQQQPLDPIAQALAELKGVTKQASVRQSADRHYGMSTPAPGSVPTPFAQSGIRGTPPPAYDQPPVSRLGAPQPAHTSKEMQRTTDRFIGKQRDVYGSNGSAPTTRPASRAAPSSQSQRQDLPRSTSPVPAPLRSASPRPGSQQAYRAASPNPQRQQQPQPYRAPSPNPYRAASPNPYAARPRAQSSSPIKPQSQQQAAYNTFARGNSPGYAPQSQGQAMPRAASPNPAYMRSGSSASRPGSSAGGNGMAMALAQPPGSAPRPQSSYYSGSGGLGGEVQMHPGPGRAGGGQFTKDGRAIVHYSRAMYMYAAAIPEELSFAKGDILAVLRLQDDGWWEAEVVGKGGRKGLVPSNYLKNC